MKERAREWVRRAGAIGFLLVLVFLTSRTCRSQSASAEIEVRVGDAGGELERLELELFRADDGELVGFYRREYERGSGPVAARWPLRADPGLYRAVVKVVRRPSGHAVRLERGVDLRQGAVIRIDLEDDLIAR